MMHMMAGNSRPLGFLLPVLALHAAGAWGLVRDSAFTPVTKHEVLSLPGYDHATLPSRHYTGHIPVKGGEHQLFYWLVESEYSFTDDPVVLWLTGGPGCSSMDAFIYEHGPFIFNYSRTARGAGTGKARHQVQLSRNPWSWSKAATMIYVDSPVGVGLSYSTTGEETESDDQQTTNELVEFLTTLLTTVHPQLKDKDFYIAGESYAGVYVPLLASKVMKHNERAPPELQINLKGYAIGNGVTDDFYDGNGQPEFAYNMGLIDPVTYNDLLDICGRNNFWNATPGGECDQAVRAAYSRFYWLNPYDILEDCFSPRNTEMDNDMDAPCSHSHTGNSGPNPQQQTMHGQSRALRALRKQTQSVQSVQPAATEGPYSNTEGREALRRGIPEEGEDGLQLRSSLIAEKAAQQGRAQGSRQGGKSAAGPVQEALAYRKRGRVRGEPTLQWPVAGVRGQGEQRLANWQQLVGYSVPCADRRASLYWLNLPEVREALHAPPVGMHEWQPCSDHLHYSMVPISMIDLHKQALNQGLRVLIYSGDHDFVVPFTGTRAWVYSLGLTPLEPYGPWYIGGQVAGFKIRFKEGLEFMTVKGAGHMVPQSNPRPALHLILRYLSNDS